MQARPDTYSIPSGYSLRAGRGPSVVYVPPGSIKNISLNTRADINPRNDPALNPNYPAAAPWETSVGWGASALSAYCGAVFADGIGAAGTLMQWCAPGHSTNLEATCWAGFDVATRNWGLIGKPLPCAPFSASPGNLPPSTQFDQSWGDWIGGSTDWPVDFRQPGYNPPFGSHTRNSFVYIPPAAAGNVKGKIVAAWNPTGNGSGANLQGGWIWDADTGLFSRTANQRPASGSACTGQAYAPAAGIVIGRHAASSFTGSSLNYLDLSDNTWVTRNATAGVAVQIDSTSFVIGDLFIEVTNGDGSPPMTFRAAPISTLKAGGSWAWTSLTVTATSWPTKSGATWTTGWARCPINGAFYAVNRVSGSNTLWKLTPPTTDGDTSGLLSGTWEVTSETLTGDGLAGAEFDYQRLRWSSALNAFVWFGDLHTSPVQAIRPIGV